MSKLKELIAELCPNGVEYKALEKCCVILDKKRKPITKSARTNGEYPYYGANGIQDYVDKYIFDRTYVLVGEDGSVITKRGTPVITWATGKIWVNNHAHIIEEISGVSLRYLYHFLQTVDVTPLIHGNIPKLTGKDFKNISIPVPPLPVQEEIVRILDSFTSLTAELQTKLQAELQARQKQYEYYRDQLLTFDVHVGGTSEVQWKTIGEICRIYAGGDAPKSRMSKEKSEQYTVPIISNGVGKNAIYGYTDEAKVTETAVTVAARGTIGYAEYRDYPYYPIIRLITLIPIATDELNPKYLYYCLQGRQYSVPITGIPQLTAPMIRQVEIPIPKLEIQKKIVHVLDNFDAICSDLNIGLPAEIEARQKQYEYYRDALLSFNCSHSVNVERALNKLRQYVFGYVMMPLSEVATCFRGEYITKKSTKPGNVPVILGGQEPAYFIHESNHVGEIVVVARSGASAGFVSYWNEAVFITDGFGYEADEELMLPKYLFYTLKNKEKQLNAMKRGAGVPHVSGENLASILLSVPTLEQQKKIVSILDRFETLCNDMTAGLPAEIEARQKQYEYYRDRLLSFPKLT